MCNKAMSCSMFRKCPNVHKEKKIEKNRKQSPKTAPWLRTPEPPITQRKEKERERKNKHHGPKKESVCVCVVVVVVVVGIITCTIVQQGSF